jgi:hypothetical protein
MTKVLDEAVEAVRRLPSADEDDMARAPSCNLQAPILLRGLSFRPKSARRLPASRCR